MWTKIAILTSLIAVLTLPAGLLALLFWTPTAAAVIFVVGWLLLVPVIPLIALYFSIRDSKVPEESTDNPVSDLKHRYAAGEIDEDEFNRRIEHLIETEEIDSGPIRRPAEMGSISESAVADEERDFESKNEALEE